MYFAPSGEIGARFDIDDEEQKRSSVRQCLYLASLNPTPVTPVPEIFTERSEEREEIDAMAVSVISEHWDRSREVRELSDDRHDVSDRNLLVRSTDVRLTLLLTMAARDSLSSETFLQLS